MHPISTPVTLTCPGGTSCPTNSVVTVAATNPYCEQTYTDCGCIGEGCVGSGGGGGTCGDAICYFRCACGPSPIIVDTTGRGFQLTSASDGVAFDIRGDGHPVKMAWTAANSGNAFLALERNHNGRIDNGKELFGDFTPQRKSDYANGYLALGEYDRPENGGNGDGIIHKRVSVYSRLLLWIDENHDGISQPNELHTLRELGVFSIGLKYRDEPLVDAYGNQFRYKGVLNPDAEDGESKDGRFTYDVFFELASPAPIRSEAERAADKITATDQTAELTFGPERVNIAGRRISRRLIF